MARPVRHRLLLAIAVGALALGPLAAPASAHRDGCHRWHSCPSDTGSYVCGDLGYYSECPGGAPDSTPVVARDDTAPREPTVGRYTARAGVLSFPLIAERGSRVVVSAGGTVLQRVVGTGGRQTVTFRGRHGSHTYEVTATDAAGNESEVTTFTADVDGRAPAAATLSAQPPGERGGATVVVLEGEPDAKFSLRVLQGGRAVAKHARDGYLDATGSAHVELLAANGRYTASVRLRDLAGNAARPATGSFVVAIPQPTLAVERTSAANSGDASFTVTGPALGTGTLTLRAPGSAAVRLPFTLDGTGTALVTTRLTDGTWTAEATVADFQRRRAAAAGAALLVDTVAPALTATSDPAAAKDRTVDLLLVAEPGSVTTVSGLPGEPVTVSGAGEHRVRREVEDGTYDVRVEAVDNAGNRTVRDLRITVTHPLTLAEAVTAVVMLALMALGGWIAWRRREFFVRLYWRRRAATARRAADRAHAAAMSAHAATVAAYRHAHGQYAQAHARWTATTSELAAFAREADDFHGSDEPLPDGVKPALGERCFVRLPSAGLVENRRRNGQDFPTVVDGGSLVVTGHRVVFTGAKRREWSFDQLLDLRHLGSAQTMMQVANRQNPSGFDYSSDVRARFRLDLALATFTGARPAFAVAAHQRLAAHVAVEPRPPAAPPAPPAPPVPVTAELLRDRARAPRAPAATAWPPAT